MGKNCKKRKKTAFSGHFWPLLRKLQVHISQLLLGLFDRVMICITILSDEVQFSGPHRARKAQVSLTVHL